jgi:hypothetical protein
MFQSPLAADKAIERLAPRVLKHEYGLPALAHELQRSRRPRTVEVVLQPIFVCETVEAVGRRVFCGGKHGQNGRPVTGGTMLLQTTHSLSRHNTPSTPLSPSAPNQEDGFTYRTPLTGGVLKGRTRSILPLVHPERGQASQLGFYHARAGVTARGAPHPDFPSPVGQLVPPERQGASAGCRRLRSCHAFVRHAQLLTDHRLELNAR